jgi:hypothetical protein
MNIINKSLLVIALVMGMICCSEKTESETKATKVVTMGLIANLIRSAKKIVLPVGVLCLLSLFASKGPDRFGMAKPYIANLDMSATIGTSVAMFVVSYFLGNAVDNLLKP